MYVCEIDKEGCGVPKRFELGKTYRCPCLQCQYWSGRAEPPPLEPYHQKWYTLFALPLYPLVELFYFAWMYLMVIYMITIKPYLTGKRLYHTKYDKLPLESGVGFCSRQRLSEMGRLKIVYAGDKDTLTCIKCGAEFRDMTIPSHEEWYRGEMIFCHWCHDKPLTYDELAEIKVKHEQAMKAV